MKIIIIIISKALFTRRKGNPGARVTQHLHISSSFT